MVDFEIDAARIVNFDCFRTYRWLVSIAEPNSKLYAFLRKDGVDLNHVFNLLGGAIALCRHSFSGPNGPKEDCIFLPVMEEDGVTPLDVVMFSMANPARFSTMLGLGLVLGLDQVFNPATYWGGEPCRLLLTPLEWLAAGIDPSAAKSFFSCPVDTLHSPQKKGLCTAAEHGGRNAGRRAVRVRRT